uniref:Uncharacterized protein n=1 Tax=Pithovirus LCPAC101 TaxID=2506586 RepID=A0A481Z2K7_9VIRU|nr:MAG: hypothetical protein LCPAC101_02550 [Pithovirus LCPAC101]
MDIPLSGTEIKLGKKGHTLRSTDNIYRYDIITNPYHPTINGKWKNIQEILHSDSVDIVNQKMISLNEDNINKNRISKYRFDVIWKNKHNGLFDDIKQLISNVSYEPITYSFTIDGLRDDEDEYLHVSDILMLYLIKLYSVDIDYLLLTVISSGDKLIYTYTSYHNNYPVYILRELRLYKLTLFPLDIDSIKNYRLLSTDTLTPYAAGNIFRNITGNNIKTLSSKFPLFLIDNKIVTDHVDRMKDYTMNLRNDGYVSFPKLNMSMSPDKLLLLSEIIKNWDCKLERVNPIIVAKIINETKHDYLSEQWLLGSLEYIMNMKIPKVSVYAPIFWLDMIDSNSYNLDNEIKFRYACIKSYLNVVRSNPLLIPYIKYLTIPNSRYCSGMFANPKSVSLFKSQLNDMLDNSEHIVFRDFGDMTKEHYDHAMSYRYVLQSQSKYYVESLIIIYEKNIYVSYMTTISSDHNKYLNMKIDNMVDICRSNILDYDVNNKTIENVNVENVNVENDAQCGINTDSEENKPYNPLYDILHKRTVNLPMLLTSSSSSDILNKDKGNIIHISDDIYAIKIKDTLELYPHRDLIISCESIRDGHVSSPDNFLRGILNTPIIHDISLNMGEILLHEQNISFGGNDLVLYSFEVKFNRDDFYVSQYDSIISSQNKDSQNIDEDILSLSIENSLIMNYDEMDISGFVARDPGYIKPLFDILLPKNIYEGEAMRGFISRVWKNGWFLSQWSKEIYMSHNKMSHQQFNIPPWLRRARENYTYALDAIKILLSLSKIQQS